MTNQKEKRKVPELRFPEFSGEWEEKSIECCFKFYDNLRKPVISSKRKKGIYPYYGATGVIDYVDDYIFDGEYLLIGEDGANIVSRNSPLIYHVKGKMWINNHAHVLVPKNKMFKFFKNSLDKVNYIPYNTGTAQPKLNIESLKKIPLYVPNNDEQQKIGEFFSKLDRQIELEEKKLALLEEQKKGYMQKIFSQELRFKDENGEEYPEWEDVPFSKIFKSNIEKNSDLEFDKNKIISVAKMQYKADNNKDSSNDYMKTYNKMRLNDIAFEGNKSKDYRYGRFVLNDIGDGIVSHVFIVFSPIMDFESSFMKYYINYEPIMGRKLLFATTSTLMMTSLKTNEFMNLSIRLPGINEQRKIGIFISTFNKKIETQNMKVSLLVNMKKQLLNKLMI